MSARDLIFSLSKEGVILTLSPTGEIRAKGNATTIKNRLPDIRENKTEIVAALQVKSWGWKVTFPDRPPVEVYYSPEASFERVRRDCPDATTIKPYEPPVVGPTPDPEAFEERAAILEYDGGMSREEAERMAVLNAGAVLCFACDHLRQPGCSDGYCSADERKDDLPLAYGRGHPLRQLPDDLGESCPAFRLNPKIST
jgi:hypothetical protein